MTFLGTPDFVHGSRARVGVMLVNLGTPDDPSTRSVRRYLRQFLSDPRVIDIPAIGRWLLLNLVILPFRPRKSAAAYQAIWTAAGSTAASAGSTGSSANPSATPCSRARNCASVRTLSRCTASMASRQVGGSHACA